jgi:hypothetical protein
MLAAVRGEAADYVPLSFMIFAALRAERQDWFGHVEAQIELGLDAVANMIGLVPGAPTGHVDAPGIPINFPADVTVRQWKESPTGARYPVLHKDYETPRGTLSVAVNQTDDWKRGDDVPLLDDFLVPRCTKYLVTGEQDLPALRYLLGEPQPDDVQTCRQLWQKGKRFAQEKGILLANGWGVGGDALGWLCGLENAVMFAVDAPEFLDALLDIISEWNRRRMELMLEVGLDLFVRRAWYEGTSYWSPALFRRFMLPRIEQEVELAHEAGASYGYIMSVGGLQFADLLLEAGIDVLIGVDPVQDHGMDMAVLRATLGTDVCLWGGMNGFVTVERGTPQQVRAAVRTAVQTLGPAGFILSPVDNVTARSDAVWQNVLALIDEWKRVR